MLVVGGVLILGAMTLSKASKGIAWGDGWHWPVPDLITPGGVRYPATISSGFRTIDRPTHDGVDIMYKRRSTTDMIAEFPPRVVDAGGAKAHPLYFAPIATPILAARDGKVWSTTQLTNGLMVVLDHGKPWATAYFHLASLHVPAHAGGKRADGSPALQVKAGDQIGVMGHAPNDGEKLRHLHFEAWFEGGNGRDAGQNPAPVMPTWGRSTWTP
jgi:murein DD-endopeptidase MepM/ murein hydrolase activator NlpD